MEVALRDRIQGRRRRREVIVIGEERILDGLESDAGECDDSEHPTDPERAAGCQDDEARSSAPSLAEQTEAINAELRTPVAGGIATLEDRATALAGTLGAQVEASARAAGRDEVARASASLSQDLQAAAAAATEQIREQGERAGSQLENRVAALKGREDLLRADLERHSARALKQCVAEAEKVAETTTRARLSQELSGQREQLSAAIDAALRHEREAPFAGGRAKSPTNGARPEPTKPSGAARRRVARARVLLPIGALVAIGPLALVALEGGEADVAEQIAGLDAAHERGAEGRGQRPGPERASQDRGSRRPKPARGVAPPDPKREPAPIAAPASAPAPEAPPAPVTPPAPVSAPPAASPQADAPAEPASPEVVQQEFGP